VVDASGDADVVALAGLPSFIGDSWSAAAKAIPLDPGHLEALARRRDGSRHASGTADDDQDIRLQA
jgi:hypothetical protein